MTKEDEAINAMCKRLTEDRPRLMRELDTTPLDYYASIITGLLIIIFFIFALIATFHTGVIVGMMASETRGAINLRL